ncbi:MAG TPA: cell division protein FtsL [Candidatus Pullichristensenella avicola]|nr:cell division protein FtsL [Candidatus Pullichristensenella avicola]
MAKLVLAGVLFVGMFVQIGMLAGISAQSKELDAVGKEIVELSAHRDNLQLSLSMLKNPERIGQLAQQMGMERPTQDAIRVVSLALTTDDTQTQTAELPGGEGAVQ